jgi:hypothetical protein
MQTAIVIIIGTQQIATIATVSTGVTPPTTALHLKRATPAINAILVPIAYTAKVAILARFAPDVRTAQPVLSAASVIIATVAVNAESAKSVSGVPNVAIATIVINAANVTIAKTARI